LEQSEQPQKKRYWITTGYIYNIFDADEHYCVYLYYGTKKGKKKFINSWAYSTFLSSRVGHGLAERKIRKLQATYKAKLL